MLISIPDGYLTAARILPTRPSSQDQFSSNVVQFEPKICQQSILVLVLVISKVSVAQIKLEEVVLHGELDVYSVAFFPSTSPSIIHPNLRRSSGMR